MELTVKLVPNKRAEGNATNIRVEEVVRLVMGKITAQNLYCITI